MTNEENAVLLTVVREAYNSAPRNHKIGNPFYELLHGIKMKLESNIVRDVPEAQKLRKLYDLSETENRMVVGEIRENEAKKFRRSRTQMKEYLLKTYNVSVSLDQIRYIATGGKK